MALDIVTVIAHPTRAAGRVALAERNPEHPLNEYGEHEIYVADGVGPVAVALTPEVNRLLSPSDGTLVRLDGDLLTAARERHTADLQARRMRREATLLERREAESDRIGDTARRAAELELQVARLTQKLEGSLVVASAVADADRVKVAHDQAIAAAEAQAMAQTEAQATAARRGPAASSATSTPDSNTPAATTPALASAESDSTDTPSGEAAVEAAERPKR